MSMRWSINPKTFKLGGISKGRWSVNPQSARILRPRTKGTTSLSNFLVPKPIWIGYIASQKITITPAKEGPEPIINVLIHGWNTVDENRTELLEQISNSTLPGTTYLVSWPVSHLSPGPKPKDRVVFDGLANTLNVLKTPIFGAQAFSAFYTDENVGKEIGKNFDALLAHLPGNRLGAQNKKINIIAHSLGSSVALNAVRYSHKKINNLILLGASAEETQVNALIKTKAEKVINIFNPRDMVLLGFLPMRKTIGTRSLAGIHNIEISTNHQKMWRAFLSQPRFVEVIKG